MLVRLMIVALVGIALAHTMGPASAQFVPSEAEAARSVEVSFPSRDLVDGKGVDLTARWLRAAVADSARTPAVILLHGCGGPNNAKGELSQRHAAMAQLLVARGYHVLFPDSFGARNRPRGICTEKIGTRTITQTNRRRDVLAALEWVANQPGVDPRKIAVLGWSHGGSAVLAATDANHSDVKDFLTRDGPRFAGAFAFYPGCSDALKHGHTPTTNTQIHIGALDDWTPPAPCVALGERLHAAKPSLTTTLYPDSYHGFDSGAPLRKRPEVPNGVNPGAGVTAGGNAVQHQIAYARMLEFFETIFR